MFAAPAITVVLLAASPGMVRIPAGAYVRFLKDAPPLANAVARPSAVNARVPVAAFELNVRPVTRREFAEFVRAQPRWRRSQVPRLFAEDSYLRSWRDDLRPPAGTEEAPATEVSWFAAEAFCRWRGLRLPTTAEWERAAEPTLQDQQAVLAWYSRPADAALPPAGAGRPNRFGVRDLLAVIWEWTLDFNSELTATDAPGGDAALFCGSGGARAVDPSDYATWMRVAFRSSLNARYAVRDLGFRCAGELR